MAVPIPEPVVPMPPPSVTNIPPPPPPSPPAGQTVDLSGNKGMAILAYLGILIIVPFLTEAKNDPFVKFHIKQGLAVIVAGIILWVLSFVFAIMTAAVPLLGMLYLLWPLIFLGLFVVDIIGILNAASGKTKELPIIGSWGDKFTF